MHSCAGISSHADRNTLLYRILFMYRTVRKVKNVFISHPLRRTLLLFFLFLVPDRCGKK